MRRWGSSYIGVGLGGGMCRENLKSGLRRGVASRLCKVSGYTTELLEIKSESPALQVLFVPGNPGVVSFYKDFLESLYDLLGGTASVTAIGHISHTKKNWERGKMFSLQQQIDHKVEFIKQELEDGVAPIVLVGHSVGAYISLETLRRSSEKVIYFIGLYPFLTMNPLSKKQSEYVKLTRSSCLSIAFSLSIASLGLLPKCASRYITAKSVGKGWSSTAIDAACSHLLKYHTFRNMLFLAKTEFKKLSETPDWAFMRENQGKIAFLFGVDDHWGPLQVFEEIAKQVPGIPLAMEREGHTHSFCCTEAGSAWVARHVASLIKTQTSNINKD